MTTSPHLGHSLQKRMSAIGLKYRRTAHTTNEVKETKQSHCTFLVVIVLRGHFL